MTTTKPHRPTVSVDFDGVIHSYESGWQGASNIPDPPVPGAIEWLQAIHDRDDVELVIMSTRAKDLSSRKAMRDWLTKYGMKRVAPRELHMTNEKVPAVVYIDDRGYRFEGTFPSVDALLAMTPWNKA